MENAEFFHPKGLKTRKNQRAGSLNQPFDHSQKRTQNRNLQSSLQISQNGFVSITFYKSVE